MLNHALSALRRGFHIFPVNPAGTVCPESGVIIDKRPHLLFPGKPYPIKWGDVATNDLRTVVEWWTTKVPTANIGIACKPSEIMVVDLDHGLLGEDQWEEVVNRIGLDIDQMYDTYTVATGSGGLHLYYRWPTGVLASQASLGPDVDVRTNGGVRGGYVLGAGSVTTKGSYNMINDGEIMDAPPELVELVRDKPVPKPVRDLSTFRQPGHASFQGLVDSVRLRPAESGRNQVLFWAARAMCEDGADIEEAYRLLVPAALECGLDGGERQARATIESGYRNQGAKR